MSIVTKGGDRGSTGLVGCARVPPRIAGMVDGGDIAMSIVTKGGDRGSTGLVGGVRVPLRIAGLV